MKHVSIDIETYSSVDLAKSGVYAYASSPDFEILICTYGTSPDDLRTIQGHEAVLSDPDFLALILDPKIIKCAFNAAFERVCLSMALGRTLDPAQWSCTMVLALSLGLPSSLSEVSALLLPQEERKMREGKALINYFSKPCAPTRSNGGRTRNLPGHDPDKWSLYVAYNRRDVIAEMAIRKKLDAFPLIDNETRMYALDQEINDRGIAIDQTLVAQAIAFNESLTTRLTKRARSLTGLDNPMSVSQLKDWIEETEGIEVDSLTKKSIPAIQDAASESETVEVLDIRKTLAKSSVAKYQAVERALCPDGRVHGLLQFNGASRTGRWAGRLVQVQNLPQNHLDELDDVRTILRSGDFESLELIYDNPADVLSQLIRTAFIPKDGHHFIVADYSAIEARVIAWMAGESWRQKVFAEGGDIYCASASKMFGVPVVKHGINGHLRQKGKIAELALGYGGSVGALKQMGALEMGLSEDELQPLVSQWRGANTKITELWRDIESAAIQAVRDGQPTKAACVSFSVSRGFLFMRLPSGRSLAYAKPAIKENRFGRPALVYQESNQTSRKWGASETYGGKLTENAVQAIARDCLATAMYRLNHEGFNIVMHIHDEVVIEAPLDSECTLERASQIMGRAIDWAPGLLLRADGYTCTYYQKDKP